MPNWCDNYISISANEETTERIHEYVRSESSAFDFNRIIPMPENIYSGTLGKKERELYGEDNWYDWSNSHWGTKWNADVENAEPGEYWFKTAWTPCEPVIAELARIFPTAQFTHAYEETEGHFYCGMNIYQDGKLVFTMNGGCDYDWSADAPDAWDEEEKEEMKIEDELYPVQRNGQICEVDEAGHYHYREYRNGRLYHKIDGECEDYRPENERRYFW